MDVGTVANVLLCALECYETKCKYSFYDLKLLSETGHSLLFNFGNIAAAILTLVYNSGEGT